MKIIRILYSVLFCLSALCLVLACKKETKEDTKVNIEILNYFPNSGNAGTLVTIKGTGFKGKLEDYSVTFAGEEGSVLSIQSDQLLVRSPKNGKSGIIQLKYADQTFEVGNYSYQSLSIHSILPNKGVVGSHVVIKGTGFGSLNAPAKVLFGEVEAIVGEASDTLLIAEVPASAISSPIEVIVDGMKSTGDRFVVQTIKSIKPNSGGPGTKVLIKGEGFDVDLKNNIVDFNGKIAQVLEGTDSTLIVSAPSEVESGQVAIKIGDGRLVGPDFKSIPPPEISEVNPLSGPSGTKITIHGNYLSEFIEENKVIINGFEIPIISATSNELQLNYVGATGKGNVEVWVNDQTSKGPVFTNQNLGILEFSPEDGIAGTVIKIKGTGFNQNLAQNQLSINGQKLEIISGSETEITAKIPGQISSGKILLEANGLQAFSSKDFRHAGVKTIASGVFTSSMVADRQGNLYGLIPDKHHIIKISANTNKVEIYAGSSSGSSGNKNGNRLEALFTFSLFSNLVIDNQDNIYVSEQRNGAIRKISPSGNVSNVGIVGPVARIAIGPEQFIYGVIGFDMLFNINESGQRNNLRPIDKPKFPFRERNFQMLPNSESLYFPQGTTTATAIGINPVSSGIMNYWIGSNVPGNKDGIGSEAQFRDIVDFQADQNGNFWIADLNFLKKVEISSKKVTSILKNVAGHKDGSLRDAQLNDIRAIAITKEGAVFIAQKDGQIRYAFFK